MEGDIYADFILPCINREIISDSKAYKNKFEKEIHKQSSNIESNKQTNNNNNK